MQNWIMKAQCHRAHRLWPTLKLIKSYQTSRSRLLGKKYGMMWKVLSHGMAMWYIKSYFSLLWNYDKG